LSAYKGATSVWVIEMWTTKSNTYLTLVKVAFGAGSICSPLISQPFLYGEKQENLTTTISPIDSQEEFPMRRLPDVSYSVRKSSLAWAFLIMGLIQLLAAIFQILILFYKKYVYQNPDKQQEVEEDNDVKETSSKKLFNSPNASHKLVIFLGAFTLGSFVFSLRSFTQFAPTFSQNIPLKLTASDAAFIHSIYAISSTIGRIICIFISLKLRPQTMLFAHYLILTGAYVMLLFSIHSRNMLIISNILFGYGASAINPAIFGFVAQNLLFTDRVGTIFMLSDGLMNV
jgi:Major Facilitator Superfamily